MPASESSIADVAPLNDRRKTLLAIRNRLADETDDTMWANHKAQCHCECGMGDGRLLVALVKELRAVEVELASLPATEEVTDLDRRAVQLAPYRARRRQAAAGS